MLNRILKFIPLLFVPAVVLSVQANDVPGKDELFPPNAKPGECYARVFVPPAYNTESKTVLKRDAYRKLDVVPASYEWATERVLVKEASQKIEVIPATYEWVPEQVMVTPATKKVEVVPAQWESMTEQVLDRPAHTVWKKGSGPIQKIDNATGEIMCLVEVPATYKTVSKRVLKAPATTREVTVPAQYEIVRKQVQKTPPTTRMVEIPAEYTTVKVKKQVSPAKISKMDVPAEYQTITNTVMASEGRMAWQPTLCETNMTRSIARDIQMKLQAKGYYNGPIDGIIGTATMNAMKSFQRENGLPQGHMTLESLKKLGISPGR